MVRNKLPDTQTFAGVRPGDGAPGASTGAASAQEQWEQEAGSA